MAEAGYPAAMQLINVERRFRLGETLAARSLASRENPRWAARWMRLSTAVNPAPYRIFQLAELLLQQGRLKHARATIGRSRSLFAGIPPVEVLLTAARIECELNDIPAAERLMRAAVEAYPDDLMAAYMLGSALCYLGRAEEAQVLFGRDAPVMTGTGRVTYSRALCFAPEPAGGLARNVDIPSPPRDARRATFFAASDSVYFCRYARQVANSLARFPDCGLHLHVVNPTPEALRLMDDLRLLRGMCVSTEAVDLSTLDDDQRKTYYSCVRYLVLPDLMDAYHGPMVVTDMDQLVMSDPAPLLDFARRHDVSMLRFGYQITNALSLFSATLLVASPTENGREFARQLRRKVAYAVNIPAQMVWHLDQAALAMTHAGLRTVDYGYIPTKMLHLAGGEPVRGRPADEGIFWSITNSLSANLGKLDLPSFQRFS